MTKAMAERITALWRSLQGPREPTAERILAVARLIAARRQPSLAPCGQCGASLTASQRYRQCPQCGFKGNWKIIESERLGKG